MGSPARWHRVVIGMIFAFVPIASSTFGVLADVHASNGVTSLAMSALRPTAGRTDGAQLTIWLNVSGTGQLDSAFLNLTFPSYPNGSTGMPAALSAIGESHPSGCVFQTNLAVSPAYLEWQCGAVPSGASYAWTVTASVNATVQAGFFQGAVADALSQVGPTYLRSTTNLSLYIEGADLGLTLDSSPRASVRPGQLVNVFVNVSNPAIDARLFPTNASLAAAINESTGRNITVRVTVDPRFEVGQGLVRNITELLPGSNVTINLQAIVASDAVPGTTLAVRANLTYDDFNRHPIGPIEVSSAPLTVAGANLISVPNLIVGAGIGLGTVLVAMVTLLYLGQRRLSIDEAFLMHRNGALVRHATRVRGLQRDDDLVARMFMTIQEFVRDSFRTQAALDELSLSGRQAAVVRGQFLILAAVLANGEVVHLYPEMLAAIAAMEGAYGPMLANWDGRSESLGGIEAILDRFVQGGFRTAWRARFT
jgi:hypothetical protein